MSPSTGIIDSAYMISLQGIIEANGGFIAFQNSVLASITLMAQGTHQSNDLAADWVINAGGLHAPELARTVPLAKGALRHRTLLHLFWPQPFGRLVYPTAEQGGLGVHVTPDLGGQVKFGPDVR